RLGRRLVDDQQPGRDGHPPGDSRPRPPETVVAKFGPLAFLSVAREVRAGAGDRRPIAVAGARELVPLLAKALREGGDASAVREGGSFADAAVVVWLGKPVEDLLRAASLAQA